MRWPAGCASEGYAVDVAYDGEDALDHLAVNAYDLVCLDLNLPARRRASRSAGGCAPIPAYAPDPTSRRRGS